jgi:geranylgeranyl reductase family protein
MSGDFDLIVVGAGPGGSNAAAAALAQGLCVAQVEREPLGRVKPCAGGLTMRACAALASPDLGAVLARSTERSFSRFEFAAGPSRVLRLAHERPLLTMVLRPDFDRALAEANRARGLTLFESEPVRAIEHDGELFRVRTARRTLAAAQLAGADGANGVTSRVFPSAPPRARAVAVEVLVPWPDESSASSAIPSFDFDALPRGYGWVFPKAAHANVGLYTLASGVRDLRVRLLEYAARKGFDARGLPVEAHTIPLGARTLRDPGLPFYPIGDAAALADALTGEGIWHALESGRIAGETAARVQRGEARPARYAERVARRVLRDTRLSWQLARLFYRSPRASLGLFAFPPLWRALVQGFAQGATLCESLGGAPRLALASRQSAWRERAPAA